MFPQPPAQYEAGAEAQFRAQVQRAIDERIRKGGAIEVGQGQVILTSPNGTRYALTVDDAGVLGTAPA